MLPVLMAQTEGNAGLLPMFQFRYSSLYQYLSDGFPSCMCGGLEITFALRATETVFHKCPTPA